MGDEVRRSGRATKGQHTKNDTPDPSNQKKGKGKGKRMQKQESEEPEEEEAIIRCVCGYTVEDKRDKRAMVCCDSCEAWQHNVHMGLSEDDDELPEQYFCEQCRPEDHRELLEAMERGEKVWEVREQEAKAAKAANRKRGKGGRKSAAASTTTVNDKDASESVGTPTRATSQEIKTEAGQKRKLPGDTPTASPGLVDNATNKMRKTSTSNGAKLRRGSKSEPARRESKQQNVSLQVEKVENISDLSDSNRRNAASALSKLFASTGKAATQAGKFKIPGGPDLATFSHKLALNVEYAMYLLLWGREETPKPEYGAQLRQILHNVKHNDDLRDELLSGAITPNDLCHMSSTDMASKELLKKTAELKKQIEQQSVLVKENEPMIRRTHKGEEVVESYNQNIEGASGSNVRRPRRIKTDDEDAIDTGSRSDSPGSADAVELPADVNKMRSPADISKLSIDTRRRSSAGPASSRKPSATFDVDKVWSSVESPATPGRRSIAHYRSGSNTNARPDPEIDRLLKEEHDDEEEYSPADYSDPDIIWGGGISMATVTEFRATAKYAAGANLSGAYPWSRLMPELLSIQGRIDIVDANTYLCGQQYSKSNDVTVVSVTPADHREDRESFNKLFDYLLKRKRYGVIKDLLVEQARDVYVIPLEKGSENPEFLELLVDNNLPTERKSRMLLVVFVIKCTLKVEQDDPTLNTTNAPSSAHQPNNSAGQQRGRGPFRTPSAPNSQMSPIAPPSSAHSTQASVPANPYASPSNQQQGFVPPPTHQSPATIPQNPYATHPLSTSASRAAQSTASVISNTNGSGDGIGSGIISISGGGGGGGGGGGLTGMAAAIHVLGDMANSPAISQLLAKLPSVGVNELGHVKDVFLSSPETKTSLDMLLPRLQQKIAGTSN